MKNVSPRGSRANKPLMNVARSLFHIIKSPESHFTREAHGGQTLGSQTWIDGFVQAAYNRSPMRRVNWTITERQHRELKRLSQETGLPISELVRRALDKYIGLVGEGLLSSGMGHAPQGRSKSEVRPE